MQSVSMLISGGGIAGSALAVLASHAGFDVTVVERAAGERSSSSPVEVHGRAYAVAESRGVIDRLRSAATDARELTIVDTDGNPVACMRINAAHRPAPHRTPARRSRRDPGGRGRRRLRAAPSRRTHGGGGRRPRRRRRVCPCGTPPLRPRHRRRRAPHSGVRRLAFGPEGDYVRFLGKRHAESADTYFDAMSQVRMPAWSTGRVCLVGDAASSLALFGDGSSSAIVGAATLAQEFAAAHGSCGDWAAAFARYERRHRRVVAPNVRGSAWHRASSSPRPPAASQRATC